MNMTAELLPLPESEGRAQARLVCEALAARGFNVPPLVMLEALANLSARPGVGVELIEAVGQAVDTLDSLTSAMSMPLPDSLHMQGLRGSLPELRESLAQALTKEPK